MEINPFLLFLRRRSQGLSKMALILMIIHNISHFLKHQTEGILDF